MKLPYELTTVAESDIEEIFDHTEYEFGQKQALLYLKGIKTVFIKLMDYPELGRKREELKKGLRAIPAGEHIVFYEILKDKIRIVRVLHSKRDIPKYF